MKFPTELKAFIKEFNKLDEMDLDAINKLGDKCDKTLGCSGGLEVRKKTFNAILFVIEKVGTMNGVKCYGLTNTLLNDEDYQRDIMRLCLKYLSADECKPEYTVPLKVVTTAIQLHANNEVAETQALVENKLSNVSINERLGEIKLDDNQFKCEPPGPPK